MRAPAVARRDWRLRLPFFYGWAIVGAVFACLAIIYTAWYSFGVFYVALLDEFGWSRAASAGVFSLFVMTAGASGIGTGALADRFGPGRVAGLGAIILAAGLLACSQIRELWQFYIFYGVVVAIGAAVSGWIPGVTMITYWFSARLGAALGIASAGIGVGILVMVPTMQLLIAAWGWRVAYQVLAALVLLVVAPIALLVLRGRPEELGLPRDGKRFAEDLQPEAQGGTGRRPPRVVDQEWVNRAWTVAGATRTRRFWLIVATLSMNSLAVQMIFVHQVAFLVDGGYDRLLAAAVVGLIGGFSMGTKIGLGSVSDRLGREVAWTIGLSGLVIGIGALMATRLVAFPPLLYVFVLLFALGYGASAPLAPAVVADLFAGRRYGSIFGAVNVSHGLGGAFGAWFAGYVFDHTGSYLLAFALATASGLISIATMWLVAPRKVRRVSGARGQGSGVRDWPSTPDP